MDNPPNLDSFSFGFFFFLQVDFSPSSWARGGGVSDFWGLILKFDVNWGVGLIMEWVEPPKKGELVESNGMLLLGVESGG